MIAPLKPSWNRRLARLLLWTLLLSPPAFAAERPAGLAGQFLVAAQTMGDPRFAQTVVYMVRHDRQGAMGLVINRPLGELPLRDLLPPGRGDRPRGRDSAALDDTALVHAGGPVQPELGLVIHSTDRLLEESLEVGAEIAVTSHTSILEAIARGERPRRHLFLLGYAGWAPGQLEAELARDDWFTIAFDEELLFDRDHATKWDRARALRAIEL